MVSELLRIAGARHPGFVVDGGQSAATRCLGANSEGDPEQRGPAGRWKHAVLFDPPAAAAE
jgi:hypothetical protein